MSNAMCHQMQEQLEGQWQIWRTIRADIRARRPSAFEVFVAWLIELSQKRLGANFVALREFSSDGIERHLRRAGLSPLPLDAIPELAQGVIPRRNFLKFVRAIRARNPAKGHQPGLAVCRGRVRGLWRGGWLRRR